MSVKMVILMRYRAYGAVCILFKSNSHFIGPNYNILQMNSLATLWAFYFLLFIPSKDIKHAILLKLLFPNVHYTRSYLSIVNRKLIIRYLPSISWWYRHLTLSYIPRRTDAKHNCLCSPADSPLKRLLGPSFLAIVIRVPISPLYSTCLTAFLALLATLEAWERTIFFTGPFVFASPCNCWTRNNINLVLLIWF